MTYSLLYSQYAPIGTLLRAGLSQLDALLLHTSIRVVQHPERDGKTLMAEPYGPRRRGSEHWVASTTLAAGWTACV